MSGTYSAVFIHLVFSTKDREPWIPPESLPRVCDYLGGAIRGEGCTPYVVGGMPDHVHALLRTRMDLAISDVVRNVKSGSSKWLKSGLSLAGFAWQEGYSAFSVSKSGVPDVIEYIQRQAEHHRRRGFKEELIEFLHKHEIEYDPRYVFE